MLLTSPSTGGLEVLGELRFEGDPIYTGKIKKLVSSVPPPANAAKSDELQPPNKKGE